MYLTRLEAIASKVTQRQFYDSRLTMVTFLDRTRGWVFVFNTNVTLQFNIIYHRTENIADTDNRKEDFVPFDKVKIVCTIKHPNFRHQPNKPRASSFTRYSIAT